MAKKCSLSVYTSCHLCWVFGASWLQPSDCYCAGKIYSLSPKWPGVWQHTKAFLLTCNFAFKTWYSIPEGDGDCGGDAYVSFLGVNQGICVHEGSLHHFPDPLPQQRGHPASVEALDLREASWWPYHTLTHTNGRLSDAFVVIFHLLIHWELSYGRNHEGSPCTQPFLHVM